jgi:hypothetical protein
MNDGGSKLKDNGVKPKLGLKSMIYFIVAGIFVTSVFLVYYFFILGPLANLAGK